MKKLLIYFLGFTIIFFIAPAICTVTSANEEDARNIANNRYSNDIEKEKQNQGESESSENIDSQNQSEDDNEKNNKTRIIRLLHSSSGEIEEIDLDEYLYGVVSSEMPASFEMEALKAQAIVARTYTTYQTTNNTDKHGNADICDNYACCQAWISKEDRYARWNESEAENNWNKIVEAVKSTSGKIITYEGNPINAFFHSNSGGVTESSVNIWGGIDYPYLKSVETVGEESYTQYSSQIQISKADLLNKIKEKYSDCDIDFSQSNCIEILEYTTSGRVKTIKFGNKEIAGTEARTILGLKSTNFTFSINEDIITFSVTGYGHGVGMSQTGADSLAKSGSNYEEIIKHFYTNVEIVELNSF